MHQIDEGIYYEDSYPGVTLGALIFPERIVMIDAPLKSEDARMWRSMLMNHRGWTNRLLVSLDTHPDRTLGVKAMETTIVTHHNAAKIFRDRSAIFKGQTSESGAEWESHSEAIGVRWAPPDITFSHRLLMHWNDSEIVLEHHPGPTPESIWVILPEERIIFVGDAVVKNQPPFLANAELEPWIEDVEMLLKSYGDYVIISGRGGIAVRDDINEMGKFLRNVSRRLERLANKNGSPQATEKMVTSLLSKFSFQSSKKVRYAKRLRYGLYQFYSRRYLDNDHSNHLEFESDDH